MAESFVLTQHPTPSAGGGGRGRHDSMYLAAAVAAGTGAAAESNFATDARMLASYYAAASPLPVIPQAYPYGGMPSHLQFPRYHHFHHYQAQAVPGHPTLMMQHISASSTNLAAPPYDPNHQQSAAAVTAAAIDAHYGINSHGQGLVYRPTVGMSPLPQQYSSGPRHGPLLPATAAAGVPPVVAFHEPHADPPVPEKEGPMDQDHDSDQEDHNDEDDASAVNEQVEAILKNLKVYCRSKKQSDQQIKRCVQARKSTKNRKLHIDTILEKDAADWTQEEKRDVDRSEQQRYEKNLQSRKRSAVLKQRVAAIQAKQQKCTTIEMEYLEQQISRKKRKIEGDRLRRSRLKKLGLTRPTPKPRVSARGPLPDHMEQPSLQTALVEK